MWPIGHSMMCAAAKTNFSKNWPNRTGVAVPNSSEFQLVGKLIIFGQPFFPEKNIENFQEHFPDFCYGFFLKSFRNRNGIFVPEFFPEHFRNKNPQTKIRKLFRNTFRKKNHEKSLETIPETNPEINPGIFLDNFWTFPGKHPGKILDFFKWFYSIVWKNNSGKFSKIQKIPRNGRAPRAKRVGHARFLEFSGVF